MTLLLVSAIGCGDPVNPLGDAPTAVDAPVDATPDARPVRCSTPQPGDVKIAEDPKVFIDEGVTWVWGSHHYILRDYVVVDSEVIWPLLLPGPGFAYTGSATLGYTDITDGEFNPEAELEVAAGPWAGTSWRGVLTDNTLAYQVNADGQTSMFATLPVTPVHPTQVPLDVRTKAGLADDRVVWLGSDGAVWQTSLATGASEVIAPAASEPIVEVVASGHHAAWRSEIQTTVIELVTGDIIATRDHPNGAALAGYGDRIIVAEGQTLHELDANISATWRSRTIATLSVDETIATVAVDGCAVAAVSQLLFLHIAPR